MYSKSQIKKSIRNPKLILNELKGYLWRGHARFTTRILNLFYPPIPEKDWDNLIILDACRYDLFREESELPGNLKKYYSNASNTAEYVYKTFNEEYYSDIVLVTSTPKYHTQGVDDAFFKVIDVWKDGWNEEYRTVLPEKMNEEVRKATEEYPNKRILAHYIPPHQPFIGETGKKMPHQVQFGGDVIQQDMDQPNTWNALSEGKYERERVQTAYRENLNLALPSIDNILRELQGKTIVTSDHGNVFGKLSEFGIIGHPPHRHIRPLIKVPWLEFQNSDRKDIIEGEKSTHENENMDEEEVKDRLEALGYTT